MKLSHNVSATILLSLATVLFFVGLLLTENSGSMMKISAYDSEDEIVEEMTTEEKAVAEVIPSSIQATIEVKKAPMFYSGDDADFVRVIEENEILTKHGNAVYVDGNLLGVVTDEDVKTIITYLDEVKKNFSLGLTDEKIMINEEIQWLQGEYGEESFFNADEICKLLSSTKADGKTPMITSTVTGSFVKAEAISFNTVQQKNATMKKGTTRVVQNGIKGEKKNTYSATYVNGKLTKSKCVKSVVTKNPVDKIVEYGMYVEPGVEYIWPVGDWGGYISSGFGYRTFDNQFHNGIDIAGVPQDTAIYAAASGTVVRSEWNNSGYGNFVMVDHGNGYMTAYAHLNSRAVSVGDKVEQGDILGGIGTTGRSTGIHLHFEIRCGTDLYEPDEYLNPSDYVSK